MSTVHIAHLRNIAPATPPRPKHAKYRYSRVGRPLKGPTTGEKLALSSAPPASRETLVRLALAVEAQWEAKCRSNA
ncbi:MAG: hypothetical protein NVSMB64_26370 [Candidatus Velthaea sp.]